MNVHHCCECPVERLKIFIIPLISVRFEFDLPWCEIIEKVDLIRRDETERTCEDVTEQHHLHDKFKKEEEGVIVEDLKDVEFDVFKDNKDSFDF